MTACRAHIVELALALAVVAAPHWIPQPAIAQTARAISTTASDTFFSIRDGTTTSLRLRREVALDLRGVSLQTALEEIARQAQLSLVVNPGLLSAQHRVTLRGESMTTHNALARALERTDLDLLITANGEAVLVKQTAPTTQTDAGAIVGRVTDAASGAGVSGASVLVEGTSLGAVTGSTGQYRIADVPAGTYRVVVQQFGYAEAARSVTVVDGGEATADFALEISAVLADALIVTAQRREESAQSVPAAVSVLTRDVLENTRSFDVKSLETLAPSMKLPVTNTNFGQGISIRGMGQTTAWSSAVEPSVATFVDGVLIGRAQATAAMQFADIERVEVLRGPQGTLFGKNASSGALLITTREPERDFHADGGVLLAGEGEYRAALNITGPLGDRAAGRLSTFTRGYDGYMRNTYSGSVRRTERDRANGLHAWGVRGKLAFQLGRTGSLKVTGEASRSDTECCAQSFVSIDPRLLPYTHGAEIGSRSTDASIDQSNRFITTSRSVSSELRWPVGGHELIAITGYRHTKHTEDYDNDRLAGDPAIEGIRMQGGWEAGRTHQVSQEMRLQSPIGAPVDYVAGLYLFVQTERHHYDRTFREFDLGVPGCAPAALCSRTSTYDADIRFRNYAAFGQANWHVSNNVTAFFGARITHDAVSYDYIRDDFDPAPIRGGDMTLNQRTTATNLSVRTGVQYRPLPELFLYGLYAQGYQGPGFLVASSVDPAIDGPLRPETADAFEAGAKLTLQGGRLLVNVTAFDARYKDRIVNAFDANQLLNRTFNAAGARTSGVELDVSAQPIRDLRLTARAAYANARHTSFPNAPCYAGQTAEQGCRSNEDGIFVQDLSGKPLNESPPWRASLAGDYTFPLGMASLDAVVFGDHVWNDTYRFGSAPDAFQSAFGLLSLGVGIGPSDKAWQVRLYGENVTNTYHIDGLSIASDWVAAYVPRDYRRRVGAELRVRF